MLGRRFAGVGAGHRGTARQVARVQSLAIGAPGASARRKTRRTTVTGGASGIGASLVTQFCRQGALVSFLEGNGTPSMVERVMIRPPTARIGPITAAFF